MHQAKPREISLTRLCSFLGVPEDPEEHERDPDGADPYRGLPSGLQAHRIWLRRKTGEPQVSHHLQDQALPLPPGGHVSNPRLPEPTRHR